MDHFSPIQGMELVLACMGILGMAFMAHMDTHVHTMDRSYDKGISGRNV